MNALEHCIKEVLEERSLNEGEIKDFKLNGLNPDAFIFARWIYDCYGDIKKTEDYYNKEFWDEAKKKGHLLM